MRTTIAQFMWGFQPHFRLMVERAAESALDEIGARALKPRVLLVGFSDDPEKRFPICVEPETGYLQPDQLQRVRERGREIYEADPESAIWHSVRTVQDERYELLKRKSRARALVEAIEASGTHPNRRFFASISAPIAGYDVHTCISVDSSVLEALPVLAGDVHERVVVSRSLPHGVITHILSLADAALAGPDPGRGLYLHERTTYDVVRYAAWWLAEGCVVRTGELTGGDLFDRLDLITSQHYEGARASGAVALARPDHPAVTTTIRFARPIRTSQTRAARKMLETSSREGALLCYGTNIYGIGNYDCRNAAVSDAFMVTIDRHATWTLHAGDLALMRVAYGRATLPRAAVDMDVVRDTVQRIFGTDANFEQISDAVSTAAAAPHGAMLVVSAAASAEVERLGAQASAIEPTTLTGEAVARVCRIDGAVVLDPQGVCHGIGVILDGVAGESGDAARGSRYNSAVRYLHGPSTPATVVLVVSEDGTVDVLPELMPRVARSSVQAALDQLDIIAAGELDPEAFARAWEEVEALQFYLSAEQCGHVNTVYEAHQEQRLAQGGLAVRRAPLRPNPAMSEEYFLDEG